MAALESQVRELAQQVQHSSQDAAAARVLAGGADRDVTELGVKVPLLREREIDLSASQVHRLVTGTPERLSLAVLAALCDIFETDPAGLITTTAANAGVRTVAIGDHPAPATVAELRPKRARITTTE